MASVRPAKSGKRDRWEARIFTGTDPLTRKPIYVSRTITAPNKRAAQRDANQLELDLRDSDPSDDSGGTFGQLLDDWIALGERTWSPDTLKEHRRIANAYLRRPLGHLTPDRITTRTLDQLYLELVARGGRCTHRPCTRPPCTTPGHSRRCQRKACVEAWTCPTHDGACATLTPCGQSPCEHGAPLKIATVHRIHVVARAALQQAVVWGWGGIRRNPAVHATPGRVVTEEVRPPGDEDVILLLAEAEEQDPRLAAYLALAIESGARRGAMHALRWSSWDGPACLTGCEDLAVCDHPQVSTIRFPKVISDGQEIRATRGKAGATAVTLGPHVTAALVSHHDRMFERALSAGAQMSEDAFLFSDDPSSAQPWYPDSTSRKVRLLGRQGLEARLKDMRHLMATQLLAAGVSPRVVADRGGWSQLHTMLGTYAHAMPASDQAAAGVLDRIYGSR